MLKTIKGKVIAGTVTVALLSSAGVAFGASDAGTNLKAWYDGQFVQASSDVKTGYEAHAKEVIKESTKKYNTIKGEATTSILGKGIAETGRAGIAISTKAQEHITAITTRQALIEGRMEGEFNELSRLANTYINETGNAYLELANRDLTRHTGQKGRLALGVLEDSLEDTTASAVSDLESAISTAKRELGEALDAEVTATTEEINLAIDTKVAKVLELITAKRDQLVRDQEKLIVDKSKELEADAKEDLQDIVNSINVVVE